MNIRNRVFRLEDASRGCRAGPEIVVLLEVGPDRPPGRSLDWEGRRLTIVSQAGMRPELPAGSYKLYPGIDPTELV